MSEAKSSNRRRAFGLPAALGLLAVLAVVAAFGVTSAFAADGTPASGRSHDPGAAYVQNGGDNGAAPDGNCPDRGSGSEQSSDA